MARIDADVGASARVMAPTSARSTNRWACQVGEDQDEQPGAEAAKALK